MNRLYEDHEDYVPYPRAAFVLSVGLMAVALLANLLQTGNGGNYTLIGTIIAAPAVFLMLGSILSIPFDIKERFFTRVSIPLFAVVVGFTFANGTLRFVLERIYPSLMFGWIFLAFDLLLRSFGRWYLGEESPEDEILD